MPFLWHSTLLTSVAACIGAGMLTPGAVKADAAPAPAATPVPTPPQVGPEATVPFSTIPGGLMLMRVRLTGSQGQQADATLLLDTGTASCCITDRLATTLGLPQTPAVGPNSKPILSLGRPGRQVVIPLLMFGNIPAPNIPFLVVGADTFTNALGKYGTTVDGIIGDNLFKFNSTVIDPQYAVVGFFAHPLTPADIKIVGMDKAVEVPLQELKGVNTFACHVRLASGGKASETDLVVDTGNNLTSLSKQDAQRLGLDSLSRRDQATLMTGGIDVHSAVLPLLTILDHQGDYSSVRAEGLEVIYPKGKFPDYAPPSVGMNVLSHYRVLLDFPEKKMYLLPAVAKPATP